MGDVVDSAAGFLGLGSGPKLSLSNANSPLENLKTRNSIYTNYDAQEAAKNYGLGKMSLADALETGAGSGNNAQMRELLANDPLAGTKLATEQLQGNKLLAPLFGEGGTLSRVNDEEKQLASEGYQLKPEDMQAYGQASGNIARLFGQQENDLTNQLAQRGLAAAPSGAAGVGFSGLLGNKYEQLAKAQTDIADKRMQNNLARLGQTRQFLSGLSQQAGQELNNQYNRQQQGANLSRQAQEAQAGLQMNQNNAQNQSAATSANFEQANKPKNFMDFATAGLGQGLQAGVGGGIGNVTSGKSWGYEAPKK